MICYKETTEFLSLSSSALKKTTLCSLTNMHNEAWMSCTWVWYEKLVCKCDVILSLWHCYSLSSDTDKFQASQLQKPLKWFQCVLCLVPLKAATIIQPWTVFQRQFLFCYFFSLKVPTNAGGDVEKEEPTLLLEEQWSTVTTEISMEVHQER